MMILFLFVQKDSCPFSIDMLRIIQNMMPTTILMLVIVATWLICGSNCHAQVGLCSFRMVKQIHNKNIQHNRGKNIYFADKYE